MLIFTLLPDMNKIPETFIQQLKWWKDVNPSAATNIPALQPHLIASTAEAGVDQQ